MNHLNSSPSFTQRTSIITTETQSEFTFRSLHSNNMFCSTLTTILLLVVATGAPNVSASATPPEYPYDYPYYDPFSDSYMYTEEPPLEPEKPTYHSSRPFNHLYWTDRVSGHSTDYAVNQQTPESYLGVAIVLAGFSTYILLVIYLLYKIK